MHVMHAGLKWNLDNGRMEVGGLVSTSNIIDSDEITVVSDRDLIWTTQLRDP
jgi:thiamine pyrophosphokinase